tara:strand:- start:303 stop:527 length:225 start_codon:yes stop_codon:yes gene_type:complete
MKPIFNPKTCELRKAVILNHIKEHRKAIDNVQICLAQHPGIDVQTFHERFNALERQHRRLIATITLHETTKKSN